jgi:hypothetical protein
MATVQSLLRCLRKPLQYPRVRGKVFPEARAMPVISMLWEAPRLSRIELQYPTL